MDTFDCIATKLDIREYSQQKVPIEIREKVLEAARLTGTGLNTQHWRFIVVEDKGNLNKLAEDSTSGKWVSNANFAIIVLTNPKYNYHMIDAGRVLQSMQLAAWNFGIGSGLFTGIREQNFREDFNIPESMSITLVIGFGYPAKKNLTGKRKNRLPINELVYYEIYR
jgi:nitroreductase